MAIITTKIIKIASRGRYVHKRGVVLGPTGRFYQERVEVVKELLKKYKDIEILEKVGDTTVKLNLENVEKDNRRKPISMMEEDKGAIAKRMQQNVTKTASTTTVSTKQTKEDSDTSDSKQNAQVVNNASTNPTTKEEKKEDAEHTAEEVKEGLPGSNASTKPTTNQHTTMQKNINQKNNKPKSIQRYDGKTNQGGTKPSTEVTPEEA